jgi:VCBS repeat-containing protein
MVFIWNHYTYTVDDGNGGSDTASVNVTVTEIPNTDPVAEDDSFTTDEDTILSENVLGNDSDEDGDDLTVTLLSEVTNGSLTLNPDSSFDYTPRQNFFGSDSFSYEVNDGNGGTDTATVNLTVNPVNDAPEALDDGASTTEGTEVVIEVLTNDTDVEGDALTVTATTDPANGEAVVNPYGTVTYTPDASFLGEDSFTYTVDDGNGGSDTATVTVTVSELPNTDPVAEDDSFRTDEDTALTTGNVLANDSDSDGDTLALSAIDTTGTLGIVTDNGDGTFDYDPNGQFESLNDGESGTDGFEYTISDGKGGTDTATVTITIEGLSDSPVIPNPVTDPLNPVDDGTDGDDGIIGTDEDDIIEGLAGNDALSGEAGNDFLDGGEGIDTAVYQFDPAGAAVDLEAGDDNGPATGSATDGYGDTDGLLSIENVIGSRFNDVLSGDGQVNNLAGGPGNDTLDGREGNDFLVGDLGNDTLTGGGGADSFLYVSPEEGGDTIEDFVSGLDQLMIVGAVFPGGLSGGVLPAEQFFIGPSATATAHRFGYDTNEGQVLFDQDGVGEAEATVLATLTGTPAFTHTDILVL